MEDSNSFQEYVESFRENREKPHRIILRLYKGNVKNVILSAIAVVLKQSPCWVIPIVTANIINIVSHPEGHHPSELLIQILIAAVFVMQNNLTSWLSSVFYSKVIRDIESRLRGAMVRKLQQLSIRFHKEIQSGRLQSKIMRDVENVELLMNQAFNTILIIILDTTVAITVTLSKSPMVLLFFLGVAPIAAFLVQVFRKPLKNRNQEFRKEMEETQAAMAEMIEKIPVTRAHGLQETEIQSISTMLEKIRIKGYRLDTLNILFGSTSWVVFQLFQVFCLCFTSYLAFRGTISVGEVVLYQNYFGSIVATISNAVNLYPTMSRGMESVNSIGEIMAAADLERNNKIIPLDKIDGKVEFRDVHFAYKNEDKEVLKGVDLVVPSGSSVAFVGGSGAGKSTLLNLLIAFDEPTGGRILIDGINLRNLDLDFYRKHIAVVPQNTILFTGTIKENISYGLPSVTDEDVWKVIEDVGLGDLIRSMPEGIHTKLTEHGSSLSGGQRQRLSIARALLRNPNIIIFDEATSALDSASEKKVQEAVEHMMKRCTVFMVAHRLSTIQKADTIVVLEDGRVKEKGSYEELMEKKGAFYRLKKLQE